MISPATNQFVCVVCKNSYDEEHAKVDKELKAPVCPVCYLNLKYAETMLRGVNIGPMMQPGHRRILQ